MNPPPEPLPRPLQPWGIVAALAAILILFGFAYYWKASQFPCKIGGNGGDCIATNVYWAVFWAVMWILSSFWLAYLCAQGTPKVTGGPSERVLFSSYLLSGIIGGTSGWLLGVYFFPTDSGEAQTFNRIAAVLGGIVSGYLLKELTQTFQYLTDTKNGTQTPLLLTPAYRECMGFFLASIMVSGGVQVAVRSLGDIRVSWDGKTPTFEAKSGRYEVSPESSYRLAGATDGSDNIAVRWRLEARDDAALRAITSKNLILMSPDGTLVVKKDDDWKQAGTAVPDFDFDVIASGAERPELAKSTPIHLKPLAAAATKKPEEAPKAEATPKNATPKQ